MPFNRGDGRFVGFLFALDPVRDLKRSARRRLYREATEAVDIPGIKVELLDELEMEITIDLDDSAFARIEEAEAEQA